MDVLAEIQALRAQAELIMRCCDRIETELSKTPSKKKKKNQVFTDREIAQLRATIRKSIVGNAKRIKKQEP